MEQLTEAAKDALWAWYVDVRGDQRIERRLSSGASQDGDSEYLIDRLNLAAESCREISRAGTPDPLRYSRLARTFEAAIKATQ